MVISVLTDVSFPDAWATPGIPIAVATIDNPRSRLALPVTVDTSIAFIRDIVFCSNKALWASSLFYLLRYRMFGKVTESFLVVYLPNGRYHHLEGGPPMAHKTISDEDLLEKALGLFRASGFEGVSVNDLATATGLEKASLYHRFPGGKEEIALAVLERVNAWFEQNVFGLLRTQASPRKRVQMVSDKLKEFYGDGTLSCVTDVLSLPNGGRHIAEKLRIAMQAWLKSFTEIAQESGMTALEARSRAEEAVVNIQGSLVLSRVSGNPLPFQKVIKGLPDLLTKA